MNKVEVGDRVQMPVHTDAWMRGDRFGEVVAIVGSRNSNMDIAHVKLDKSGKVTRVHVEALTHA